MFSAKYSIFCIAKNALTLWHVMYTDQEAKPLQTDLLEKIQIVWYSDHSNFPIQLW